MDAHLKNVEASSASGKYDPAANLALTGIAGTVPEKEDEQKKEKEDEGVGDTKEEKGDQVGIYIIILYIFPLIVYFFFR